MKKIIFVLAALVLATGPALAQVSHYQDDRDLFIGVDNAASIRPNIMVLADNSGSMNTAIYHPAFNPKLDYTHDASGTALNLDEFLVNFNLNDYGTNSSNLSSIISFNICRGRNSTVARWDLRARFNELYRSGDYSRWEISKYGIDNQAGIAFPVVGQVIDYDGWGTGVDDQAIITNVSSKNGYWLVTVTGYNGPPSNGAYIYINYHLDTSLNNDQAWFVEVGDSCTGFELSFSNVQLYGSHDLNDSANESTRYDRNYLYWLAFFATEQQINEVTYWATSGKFPDKSGTLVDFGYTRIEVLRRVLADVMREVHGDVNLGLAAFNSEHGGYIRENLTNFNTLSALDSMIKTNIENLTATTWTPLSEALASVWYYLIGQNTSTIQPHTDSSVAQDCPLEDYCQKQYVILMTDGESTRDRELTGHDAYGDSFYTGSYFATHPVSAWGDEDGGAHDPDPDTGVQPTELTKPDGTPYCPNNSCWQTWNGGSDLLDDVAWYMAKNDHFPDALFDPCYGLTGAELEACSMLSGKYTPAYQTFLDKYQGMQSVETYVIGFNMDNDLLMETAANGNGEYYVATSYDNLKKALTNAIVSIQLRNMAFAAFTAPKKITSTVGEGFSFVGYFMPSLVNTIWGGHLQSYKMTDYWYADLDGSGSLEESNAEGVNEFTNRHDYEVQCTADNPGLVCLRNVVLASVPEWDTQQKLLTATRSLFTHDSETSLTTLIPFTAANAASLQPLFQLDANADPAIPLAQAQTIISSIGGTTLGDIFHSDIAYVGPPMVGKKYIKNLNPTDCDTTPREADPGCYEKLLTDQVNRDKVIYVGTNDGILHQVDATTDVTYGGSERWGFIPDEVLPKLKNIVIDENYTYTVDGRLHADDIYYRNGTDKAWKTILVFGLKDGGDAFYCLDVTDADSDPVVMWKFKDEDYSGRSWSKPFVGKIRELQADDTILDRWVVVLAGGMAFNNENTAASEGKSVFVIDASTGKLIWMLGYNSAGAADAAGTAQIDTTPDDAYTGDGVRYLTAKPEFSYPIPSAITPVDRDSDGFLDTIYFGNVAGHLFKADISSADHDQWKAYQLYKKEGLHAVPQASTTISSISGNVLTLDTGATGFDLHRNVFGLTSKAMGTIDAIDSVKDYIVTVTTISPSSFIAGETLVIPSYDPIYLSPAVFFDKGYNLWVAFGSGDRTRSRTNPDSGKFLALRDGTTTVSAATVQKTDILLSDLVPLTWTGMTMDPTSIKVDNKWGWWFTFPMSGNGEKLFDPEPIVLPDMDLVPHIYFNTYQPSPEGTTSECDAPKNGIMYYYDLACDYSGTGTVGGYYESGRIAGGGVFQGTDYIVYVGKGDVASIPPLQDIKPIKLIYTGSLLFMKEKKR
ncbi:MAG: PilC/PilY family type IV pilus protein [Chloroflexota bacterium]